MNEKSVGDACHKLLRFCIKEKMGTSLSVLAMLEALNSIFHSYDEDIRKHLIIISKKLHEIMIKRNDGNHE